MPLVCYVSELEKNVSLDAERLLRLLGVSGKLSGFHFAVYMLEQVQEKPEYQSIEKMDVLLQMLTVLFRCGHTAQAFDIICALFQTSGLTLPQEFYSGIKTDLDKHKFVGEFLTDFQEILDELHI